LFGEMSESVNRNSQAQAKLRQKLQQKKEPSAGAAAKKGAKGGDPTLGGLEVLAQVSKLMEEVKELDAKLAEATEKNDAAALKKLKKERYTKNNELNSTKESMNKFFEEKFGQKMGKGMFGEDPAASQEDKKEKERKKNKDKKKKQAAKKKAKTNGDKPTEPKADGAKPKAAAAAEDSEDEGPELPLIAEEKVNPKKGPQRSALILDIVGDSPELDMKALEDKIREYNPDGLTWGDSELQDLAFGIKILRIAAALLNDKVKAEDVVASLEKVENVQSVEIHSHNTL